MHREEKKKKAQNTTQGKKDRSTYDTGYNIMIARKKERKKNNTETRRESRIQRFYNRNQLLTHLVPQSCCGE